MVSKGNEKDILLSLNKGLLFKKEKEIQKRSAHKLGIEQREEFNFCLSGMLSKSMWVFFFLKSESIYLKIKGHH